MWFEYLEPPTERIGRRQIFRVEIPIQRLANGGGGWRKITTVALAVSVDSLRRLWVSEGAEVRLGDVVVLRHKMIMMGRIAAMPRCYRDSDSGGKWPVYGRSVSSCQPSRHRQIRETPCEP